MRVGLTLSKSAIFVRFSSLPGICTVLADFLFRGHTGKQGIDPGLDFRCNGVEVVILPCPCQSFQNPCSVFGDGISVGVEWREGTAEQRGAVKSVRVDARTDDDLE